MASAQLTPDRTQQPLFAISDTHAESLKDLLRAQPFQPFTVHAVSGATYLVDHPDFVWFTRGGRTVYISLPGGEGERVRILDTALVERLETTDTPQPA